MPVGTPYGGGSGYSRAHGAPWSPQAARAQQPTHSPASPRARHAYMERLLLQVLHNSPAARGFSFIIGATALVDDLARYTDTPRYQRLVIDFASGEIPDDAYSRVPYEKGANLILHLGTPSLPVRGSFVDAGARRAGDVPPAWLYGDGLKLPVEMTYDATLAQAADTAEFTKADLDGFNANQIIVFLERLQALPALPRAHHAPRHAIRLHFYALALAPPTSDAAVHFAPEAARWVVGVDGTGVIKGRMKFCQPIFKAVCKIDSALALET
ncbi:hypothetical protein B0H17DRAFT_1340141 [Mycena rosella]|uniref:Peptidase M1 leukotriene A4 hydrolase/aminopeptidase C-terminal domain-containing protein n=1 Tax=Mycena rosella TaxID=1033263 RepID=A0AAD7BQR7_MYCRO|nr:hypothetical protein B0H17DRAFT_1340141 [Mycena rosella]